MVFADAGHGEARALLAEAYDHLGHGAENATWRNFFLTGALELREGVQTQGQTLAHDLLGALTVEQVFDGMAIRLDGPRAGAAGLAMVIDWHITDEDAHHRITVRNGVVVHERPASAPEPGSADAAYALTRAELLPALAGLAPLAPVTGDPGVLADLQAHLDRFDPDFAIVEP